MTGTDISSRFSPVLRPWKRLDRANKIREAIKYAGAHNGKTINLNLSDRFHDLILRKDNPMATIRKRVHEDLKTRDLHHLPLVLVLETTRSGSINKVHLHGVVIPYGCSEERIQTALRDAVGYVSGRSGSTQFQSAPITDAEGWWRYLRKDKAHTCRSLALKTEKHLWFMSRSMTQVVRDHYESVRLGRSAPANVNGMPVDQSK